jgi:deazaflavin-dependent oxidoreductase (nitroreductase family)
MDPSAAEHVVDSPIAWVAEHVRAYVESGGKKGHRRGGRHALLLTTRGRRTGLLRRTALYYGRDGDRYVVASNGGSRRDPPWYLNLMAEPRVVLQIGPEVFAASARPATAEERPRLWRLMVGLVPYYEAYQKKTQREIPVVVLERSE